MTITCLSTRDRKKKKKQMYSAITELIEQLGFYMNFTVNNTGEYHNIYIEVKVTNGLESDVAKYLRNSIRDTYLTTNRKGYYVFKKDI